jgi:hypothetical protein
MTSSRDRLLLFVCPSNIILYAHCGYSTGRTAQCCTSVHSCTIAIQHIQFDDLNVHPLTLHSMPRALACLPYLHKLGLICPTAPALYNAAPPSPGAEDSRPLLPSMRLIGVDHDLQSSTDSLPLYLLATTTRVPPDCVLEQTGFGVANPVYQVVEVRTCSTSWLEMLLKVSSLAPIRRLLFNFVLFDNKDIDAIVAALESLHRPGEETAMLQEVAMCFGLQVNESGLRKLASKLRLVGKLKVGGDSWVKGVVQRWEGALPTLSRIPRRTMQRLLQPITLGCARSILIERE